MPRRKPTPKAKRERIVFLNDESAFTDDEVRLLAALRGSPTLAALWKSIDVWRKADKAELLDESTGIERTQYLRGRLNAVADVVLLLEHDAAAALRSRAERAAKERAARGSNSASSG